MIEWIIFAVLALTISEVLFLRFGKEEEWIPQKMMFLILGAFGSCLFFLLPYSIAYHCEIWSASEEGCVNQGIQAFYWLYGIIIGIVLFFLLNKWLLKKIRKPKKEKKK